MIQLIAGSELLLVNDMQTPSPPLPINSSQIGFLVPQDAQYMLKHMQKQFSDFHFKFLGFKRFFDKHKYTHRKNYCWYTKKYMLYKHL